MQIINLKSPMNDVLKGSVLAIGNFDGVHKGHQQLISQAIEKAHKSAKPAGILTFEPHPISFFSPKAHNYRLTPFDLKMKLLENSGLDFVAYAEFDNDFAAITATDFIEKLVIGKLAASEVITGEDFIFGNKRGGNSIFMEKMSKKLGFKFTPIHEINDEDSFRYSSSRVREFLRNGNVTGAAKILGRNYTITGKVQRGKQDARSLGFPTANIDLQDFVIPKYGVYKVLAEINGIKYPGVANIGIKPTYGKNSPLLEVHLLNFNNDIYGENISVELLQFIREERKFNSLDELKDQIKNDIGIANE